MAVIKSGASVDQWTIDATSKAGRVTLYDTTNHPIGSQLGLDSEYNVKSAITQNVWASSKNSSLALSIGASSYWEGTSESTLGVAGIQINVVLTQAYTLTLYQSMDNSTWDVTDIHDMPAGYGEGRTYQATASYYKVRITNKSGVTTATGKAQSALCPIVECLPRALTKGGNLKVTASAEWQSNSRTTGLYTVSSPRTIGLASAPQNLFVLQNPSSTYWITIRSLTITTNTAGTNTTLPTLIRASRGTSISGGTSWTANIAKLQTSYPSPQATCLVDTASDDGALTALTATAGTTIYTQCMDKAYTQVGWFTHPPYSLIPDVGADLRQIIIAPGENLLIQATTTAMPANQSVFINCAFTEMLYL